MKALHQGGPDQTRDSEPFEFLGCGRRDTPVGPDYFKLLVINGSVGKLVTWLMIDSQEERESSHCLNIGTALNLSAVSFRQRVEHSRLAVTDQSQRRGSVVQNPIRNGGQT